MTVLQHIKKSLCEQEQAKLNKANAGLPRFVL